MLSPKQPKKAASPKVAQPQKKTPPPAKKEANKITETIQAVANTTVQEKSGTAGNAPSKPQEKAVHMSSEGYEQQYNEKGNPINIFGVEIPRRDMSPHGTIYDDVDQSDGYKQQYNDKGKPVNIFGAEIPRRDMSPHGTIHDDVDQSDGYEQQYNENGEPINIFGNVIDPFDTAPNVSLEAGMRMLAQQNAAAKARKTTTAEEKDKAEVTAGEAATTTQSPSEVIDTIAQQPPLTAFTNLANAGNALQQSTQNAINSTQEDMDEITISSGISAATEPKTPKPKAVAQQKAPVMHTPASAEKVSASKDTQNIESTAKAGEIKEVSTAKGAFVNNLKQSRAAAGQISGAAQNDLGTAPDASFDAASNPDQMAANTAAGQQSVTNTLANAQQATTQDFGESGMFPKQTDKKARVQLTEQVTEARSGLSKAVEAPQFSEQERIEVNKQLETQHGAEMANAQAQLAQAETEKETGVTNETANLNAEMQTATEDAKAQQRAERAKGQASVAQQKQNWQSENQKIKGDAESKLSTEQAKSESKIAQKQAEGDQKIAETYAKADDDIAAANKDADEKIAAKEKEGEKAEEKGWLDSAIDWVSEQFDKIKEAVNAVFDALRAAVKKAVAWAKEKASSIINTLRDFAVSAIKAFGELAKSIVNIALAAFPGIAKKFNALIDMAVNAAVTAVNIIASALEKAVHALIDLAGKVIDGIIAIYQKAINLALDVLEAITVGVLIIIKKIGWLGVAAKSSPEHFFPQMGSELLGQDLEEPLENEIPKVFGLTMDDVKKNDAIAASMGMNEMTEEATSIEDTSILDKNSYVASDFDVPVQENPQLSDALMAEIAAMPEGVPVEIGAVNDDEHGIDAVKADLAATAMTTPATSTDVSAETTADAGPPFVTTEMMNNIPESDKKAQGWVGPFTSVWDRTKAAAGGMVDGVTKWWEENKVGLLIKLGLGIAGLILANVLTGGAIMAALPLFLELLSAYFLGDAIYQLGKHFKSFLLKGWDGDIQGASKSLARGLAILVIELVFALLFGAKAVFKSVKAGVKAAKGGVKGIAKAAKGTVKNYAKQQVKNGVRLAAVTRNGAKRAVKKGKIAMQGMKQGSLKGAKSLKGAGKALSKRLGFDRFRITRSGKFFKLEGHVNPWVLLASGEVKHVDADKVKGKKLGSKVDVDGQEGFLIGKRDIELSNGTSGIDGKDVTGSKFAALMDDDTAKAVEKFQKLIAKGTGPEADELRRALLNVSEGTRELRKGITGLQPKHFQAHHIIPRELLKEFKSLFKKMEFDIEDGLKNGVMLAPDQKVLNEFVEEMVKKGKGVNAEDFVNRVFHKGSHPNYTDQIRNRLETIQQRLKLGIINEVEAMEDFDDILIDVKTAIKNNKGKNINDIII